VKNALFVTLGCRLNQLETEGIAQGFREAGWQVSFGATGEFAAPPGSADGVPGRAEDGPAENPPVTHPPDLCVVNTCTVTSKAEQKVRRAIRDLLRRYPDADVAVTGCYAVVEGAALSVLDERVRVVPRKEALLPALDGPGGFFPFTAECGAHSRSLLKVQDGCDGHCTYCRIRLARGPSRSLGAKEVLKRLRLLEAAGHREAVLTGVNLGAWAGALPRGSPPGITGLIGYLLAGTRTIALRISSLHPTTVTEAFAAVVSHPRVRPHFHLSVQSGSSAILAAMGRPYPAEVTLEAVERLRAAKGAPFIAGGPRGASPGETGAACVTGEPVAPFITGGPSGASPGGTGAACGIGEPVEPFIAADIIAGFPGETSADFAATLALCRAARFAWVHCFPFSPRPGTAAAVLPGALPQRITGERVRTLTDYATAAKLAYVSAFQGRTLPAIVEHNLPRAVTANFLHVTLDPPAPAELAGQEVGVRIREPQHGGETDCQASLQSNRLSASLQANSERVQTTGGAWANNAHNLIFF
jgi:threonylcarbamoyladenosine tRNA methylthiotransferase MtaB